MRLPIALIFAGLSSAAAADGLTVQFTDGVPKDTITLTNGNCLLNEAVIVIDLSQSAAGLIFDVTAAGAGVAVFHPVEVTAGTIAISPVVDGGQVLHLRISDFPIGATFSLSADLDDTTSGRQRTVTGAEMAGATVTLVSGKAASTAVFGETGLAILALPPGIDGCETV
jgi:hypothetical protein